MNKRIRELYNECFVVLDHDEVNVGFDFEKFTDLIVRECVDEIHGYDLGSLTGKSDCLDRIAEHIENHFGIKS